MPSDSPFLEPPLAPPPEVITRVVALRGFFDRAEKSLESGQPADLSRLESDVAGVCRVVQACPVAQQGACIPLVSELIDRLAAYTNKLDDLQRRLAMSADESPSEGSDGRS